ncbi:MAG: hypothetical protein NVV59_07005 [Chitinophagaceae bacterium]|nr:hypothetical protein [Chitinophagaceae bacterium]
MKTIGKFKVQGVLKIAARGVVLIGDVIEGVVKVGGIVVVSAGAEVIALEIKDVDIGDKRLEGGFFIGITFKYENERAQIFFESLQMEGKILEVIERD